MNRHSTKLDCDHVVWYSPVPKGGDTVWCRECKDYRIVEVNYRITVIENGYIQRHNRNKYHGECIYEDACDYKYTAPSAKKLEAAMFKHIAIMHGESTLLTYNNGELNLKQEPTNIPPF